MPRTKPIGIPARAVLAGGITRHGPQCGCAYCAPDIVPTPAQRQAIPIIRAAGVLQPPVKLDDAFAHIEATVIPALEAERDARDARPRPRTYEELQAAARARIAPFERSAS